MVKARLIAVAAAVLVSGIVLGLPLLSITGPEQAFTLEPGGSTDSYLRVSNDGTTRLRVSLQVLGNVTGMVEAQTTSFSLDPGASRRVVLHYQVPSSAPCGRYAGEVIVSAGEGVTTALARDVLVMVAQSMDGVLALKTGLNLVGWPGPEVTFAEAFSGHPEVAKVWRRTDQGGYAVATYYAAQRLWWSPDPSFDRLQTGEAYFLECEGDVAIGVEALGFPASINIVKGTNLVGWTGPTTPVVEAFPQSPSHHPVDRIWKRKPDGSYSSIEYYPSFDTWWGADPDFTSLEWGHAYFIEASDDTVVMVGR